MPTKFIQLPLGQPFVYEGQGYVKSSPLMGREQTSGRERLIPRSALVETAGPSASVAAPSAAAPSAAQVAQALGAFRERVAQVTLELEQRGLGECADQVRVALAAAVAELERGIDTGAGA